MENRKVTTRATHSKHSHKQLVLMPFACISDPRYAVDLGVRVRSGGDVVSCGLWQPHGEQRMDVGKRSRQQDNR